MEPTATHIGIEPGSGLIGRFGDTVILIPRGSSAARGADETARDLFDLAAAVASGGQRSAGTMAARLAAWVIGHMSGDVTPFGIVTPVDDGVVVFLRGAVWCCGHRGLRNPPAVRRAGADLGRSDAARYVRAAGDRRHG